MAEQYPSKPPDFKHKEFNIYVKKFVEELRTVAARHKAYLKFEDYHAALQAVYSKYAHYFGSSYLG